MKNKNAENAELVEKAGCPLCKVKAQALLGLIHGEIYWELEDPDNPANHIYVEIELGLTTGPVKHVSFHYTTNELSDNPVFKVNLLCQMFPQGLIPKLYF